MTTQTINSAIALATPIIAANYSFQFAEVGPSSQGHDCAAYDGVMIYRKDGNRVAHIYLNDDDARAPQWMVDLTDLNSGDTNPEPMTLAALNKISAWVEG